MPAPPLNPRPGDALKDLIPLLPIEDECGIEKFRAVCGAEKLRVGAEKVLVGLEKFRERNALVDPERNLLAFKFLLDDLMLERFALNLLALNLLALNLFTLDDPTLARLALNPLVLADAMLALLVVLPILLSADIFAR